MDVPLNVLWVPTEVPRGRQAQESAATVFCYQSPTASFSGGEWEARRGVQHTGGAEMVRHLGLLGRETRAGLQYESPDSPRGRALEHCVKVSSRSLGWTRGGEWEKGRCLLHVRARAFQNGRLSELAPSRKAPCEI